MLIPRFPPRCRPDPPSPIRRSPGAHHAGGEAAGLEAVLEEPLPLEGPPPPRRLPPSQPHAPHPWGVGGAAAQEGAQGPGRI